MVTETEVEQKPDPWDLFLVLYADLKAAKPAERSEKARRFAVLLTEFEKVMSYYLVFCESDNFTGEIHGEEHAS